MIQLASRVRAEALKMIHDAGTGHTGGALSVADILTVLYADVMNVFPDRPDAPERDRFPRVSRSVTLRHTICRKSTA